MDPRDFNSLAAQLAGGATAAHCRSAISRAYYAAFNVAAQLLRGIGCPPGKGGAAHGDVQKFLGSCGDPAIAATATDLGSLHSRRIRADYQMDKTDVESPANALAVVRHADSMILLLDQ